MTKGGTLGYIASFPIPEVVSGINATILGAQSVRPDVKVKIIWVNSWYDPGKEAAAARALADQGADVLMQHTDFGRCDAIRQRARHLRIRPGLRHDQVRPEGATHRDRGELGPLLCRPRQARARQTSGPRATSGAGFATKIVHMAPYTNMPTEVKKLAEDTEAAISSGKLHPFKCPVLGQDGKPIECKGGIHLDDGQILGMNYYVKGIDEKPPAKLAVIPAKRSGQRPERASRDPWRHAFCGRDSCVSWIPGLRRFAPSPGMTSDARIAKHGRLPR